MSSWQLSSELNSGAPLYRRTEGDPLISELGFTRITTNNAQRADSSVRLQQPHLISSWKGSIERVLLCLPYWAASPDMNAEQGYRSVIDSLRVGTKFVIVHNDSVFDTIREWFSGHPAENVEFIGMADYVGLTDWAEDAYVSLVDESDSTTYLMEPWAFPRRGDALIADAVEEGTSIKASQAPLTFQGGNCLIADDFWLIGKDYFIDSLSSVHSKRGPLDIPEGTTSEDFVYKLFSDYLDKQRRLVVLGTDKPVPLPDYLGRKEGDRYYLENIAESGVGNFQPIFHIDMFVTLVGPIEDAGFTVLVGSPRLAKEILGTSSPFELDDVFDRFASQLQEIGCNVIRNPIVHRSYVSSMKMQDLVSVSSQPGQEALAAAMKQLRSLGASNDAEIWVRTWYHATWNNCLVENSATVGKNVYLPTYGHGKNKELLPVDESMKALWEQLGFNVIALGDFNSFARRQGVVHCIKKYLQRGA